MTSYGQLRQVLGPGSRRLMLIGVVLAVLGLGLYGWMVRAAADHETAQRIHRAYLTNYVFYLSLALGALFFLMVSHLTRAGWSVAARRVIEAVAATLLPLAPLALPIWLGREGLYEWTHAAEVARDPLLQHKSGYLNEPFFLVRLAAFLLIWVALSRFFLRRSLRQDDDSDPRITMQMEALSAPGLIVFALTVTFAMFDLLMSLTPHWYSTIFGVYYFAGSALGIFALTTVIAYTLQRAGYLQDVINTEHFHDLGKLTFAFVVFWAYIAFSQYMLIWYGDLPEETEWYLERQQGHWLWGSLLLLFGHFVFPFLALMSRHVKRRLPLLVALSLWILAIHWWDMFWLVMPGVSHGEVHFVPADLVSFLGLGGVFLFTVVRRFARHSLVPIGDPRLGESLEFENA